MSQTPQANAYLDGIDRGCQQMTSRAVSGVAQDYSTPTVNPEIAQAIQLLHTLLSKEYGCDFAYQISGRGETLGASNYRCGYILPRTSNNNPKRESDPHALPDVEVFHLTRNEAAELFGSIPEAVDGGWYWWTCLPGCLPDSDAIGPFKTAKEALKDAQSYNDNDDE